MRRNNSGDRFWTLPNAANRMDQLIGRKHTAQLLSIIGIVCGILCLITGVCVIFTWAFVPDFSRLYPVGLYAGAVVSALGACFLLLSVVSLCLWQRVLKRTATRIRSSLSIQKQETSRKVGNVCQLPTCHSIFEEDECERLGSLKKASSTAYISLGSVQSERLKLVGVIKGTISTTELDRSIRASTTPRDPICSSSVPTRSATVLFHGDSKPVFTRYAVSSGKQPIMRDKCLRRSLPRVLIQTPNGKGTQSHDRSNSERLAKARSEGLKLDSLNQTSPENDSECNGVNVDVDEESTSPTPVSSAGGRLLTRVSTTPPVGQASLFNLNHNTTPTTFGTNNTPPTDGVSSPTKLKHSSRSSLDRSGKRYLLMNQSGDVISCTTLFGGEEADDEPSVGPASTTNCRRLQACAGWNFFPVFVQQDPYDDSIRSDDDENRVRHRTTSYSPHTTSLYPSHLRTSSDTSAPMEQQQHQQHYFGWFTRIRRFVRERLKIGRRTTQAPLPDEFGCEGGQTVLLARSAEEITERKRRNVCRAPKTDAKANTNEMDGLPVTDESTRQQGLDEMTGSCSLKGRKQTVISNASVFSLPAIAPELWAAERPVWIMGVPVDDTHWVALDTCDLIFMKEEDRVGSADSVKPVTGSTSSIYAFHVKPPSRLKPARRIPRTRCGRARSLGRILLSEKQSKNRNCRAQLRWQLDNYAKQAGHLSQRITRRAGPIAAPGGTIQSAFGSGDVSLSWKLAGLSHFHSFLSRQRFRGIDLVLSMMVQYQ
ncbi:hypothetical protein X801_05711, partial [Opisthorchis viverrini]